MIGACLVTAPLIWQKLRTLRSKTVKRPGRGPSPTALARSPTAQSNPPTRHFEIFKVALRSFHSAQCYYAISLQIAALIALYGHSTTIGSLWDELVVLVVSADGLIPVVIAFYALANVNRRDMYMAVLTGATVLLSSITGYHVIQHVKHVDFNETSLSLVDQVSDVEWPAACGGTGLQYLCPSPYGQPEVYNAPTWLKAIAISVDIIVILLFLCSIFLHLPDKLRSKLSSGLFKNSSKIDRSKEGRASGGFAQYMLFAVHVIAGILLAFFGAVEFFFLHALIAGNYLLNRSDWSFGQIVGILIWVSIIIDFSVEEGSKPNLKLSVLFLRRMRSLLTGTDMQGCFSTGAHEARIGT